MTHVKSQVIKLPFGAKPPYVIDDKRGVKLLLPPKLLKFSGHVGGDFEVPRGLALNFRKTLAGYNFCRLETKVHYFQRCNSELEVKFAIKFPNFQVMADYTPGNTIREYRKVIWSLKVSHDYRKLHSYDYFKVLFLTLVSGDFSPEDPDLFTLSYSGDMTKVRRAYHSWEKVNAYSAAVWKSRLYLNLHHLGECF